MVEIPRDKLVVMMEAGYVYLGMRRYKEAMEVFEGVSSVAPDSDVPIVAMGSVAFCQGNFKGAVGLYKKALKIDPKSLFAKVYMAESLFFNKQKDAAVLLLDEVDKSDPKGAAGDFARALRDAIKKGFTPDTLESNVVSKGKDNGKGKKTRKIRG